MESDPPLPSKKVLGYRGEKNGEVVRLQFKQRDLERWENKVRGARFQKWQRMLTFENGAAGELRSLSLPPLPSSFWKMECRDVKTDTWELEPLNVSEFRIYS